MSNRKTRKQKILSKQRNRERKSQLKELNDLKVKAFELEKQIAKQKHENFKEFHIRNLKIFKNTCNFVTPFVISAGLTVGVVRIFGGGFPFYSDEIVKYKTYSLDYQTKGYVSMNEEYRTNRWFDDSLPSNKLTIYTPWRISDDNYVRYKQEYNIGKLNSLDLINAVLDEDYYSIMDNIRGNTEKFSEETQIINSIEENEKNDYFFQASLHVLDKEDVLKYNETDRKNAIVTIADVIVGLGIGVKVARSRDFNYLDELREVNNNYRYKVKSIKPMEKELEQTNRKILSLTKKKVVKPNE